MSNKRIVPVSQSAEVTIVSGTDLLMARAMRILHKEVEMLERAVSVRNLDDKDARRLQGYIKCIVDLSKEKREIEKSMDLGDMPKEAAIAHLKALLTQLEGK